ncbi:ABC transporter permease [Streptomyces sp. WAC05374]|uniref:ABC transporter permease n=1 Tax=Streptomyces sp. WAC05374 TaxID=2487420 RepID=UPI000F897AE1|nr:ABC transporter permease [Streptomyces sp. WAC05374]RST19613.1 ABC transporter permease [Streptomyces sp. WAC05374]TDF50050.1 ABC transporter permease [Streptomyces sp. WAC05374]TDF57776.1 ABC transporter permease [Streptomyces sp. WAC05374]TDF60304.1 ABC transporter permease [Streptomyces sp. WAC05374]
MSALTGAGTLARLALRRDRLMLPLWAAVVGGMVASGAGSIGALYDTPAARAEVAASMNANSSVRSLYGPVFGDSTGALVAWRFGVFAAALAAVMSLIIVVRHTREEEETGRQEMLSAGQVGRRAPLTSALLTALTANAAVALLIAAGLAGEGAAGAVALGLAVGGTGMVFATMAAIVAQLTESARLAKGLTAAVLGLAFLLRAAGDAGGASALTWLSPVGWAENVRAFAAERWWVLLLMAAAVAAQAGVAYGLAGRRDVGMSFLPARPGPASGRLATAGALAWRLQRSGVLGWTLGFLAAGLVFGGMVEGASDLVGDNVQARQIFERMGGQSGLENAFLAAMTGLFGMVAALYVVGSVLRLHGEETSGRAEPVLATAVGRLRWAAGHLLIAFGGSVLLMVAAAAGLTLSYGREAGPVLGAALAQLPAVWTLGGVAVLLYGALPKAAPAGWGVAGLCLALGWIGPALDLPQLVLNISPFGHIPKLPGTAVSWPPLLILGALTGALVTAGLTGLRRRDLVT